MAETLHYATGRRKNAVARVFMRPGDGTITINGMPLDDYFTVPTQKMILKQPLEITNTSERFNIWATVKGGGKSGQAGAVKHGITRALMIADPEMRTELKKAGFVTRDDREKERKKYGQKGARAKFQYSKR